MMFKIALVLATAVAVASACALSCEHNGSPNSGCTACEQCAPGWTGKTCSTWKDPSFETALANMLVLAAAGASNGMPTGTLPPNVTAMVMNGLHLPQQPQGGAVDAVAGTTTTGGTPPPPPPPLLNTGVGLGVDVTTGQLKLPMLNFTVSGSGRYKSPAGHSYAVPHGLSVHAQSGAGHTNTTNTLVFESMYDYIQMLHGYSNTSKVTNPGSFAVNQDLTDLYTSYFNGDAFMTTSRSIFPMFATSMSGTPTKDSYALQALQALPPDYSTDTAKSLYRTFVQYWGTHYVQAATAGGMVDLQSFVQKRVLTSNHGPFSAKGIEQMADTEFEKIAWQKGAANINKNYTSARTLGSLACTGGNAAELCQTKDLASQWIRSIGDAPVAIELTLKPISSLLSGQLATNVQHAIDDFITEQYNKWTVNFPSCPDCLWGTCEQGSKTCTCFNPNIVGATCDSCASGWHNNQCLQATCDKPCYGGACTSPNTCTCYAPYYNYKGKNPQCYPTCGDGILQPPEQCDEPGNTCCAGCQPAFGAQCRMSMGPCDVAETCQYGYGMRGGIGCPPNRFASGKTCHIGIGACDSNVMCDGSSAQCPAMNGAQQKAGQPCGYGGGANQCMTSPVCSGYSTTCPSPEPRSGSCTTNMGQSGQCMGGQCESMSSSSYSSTYSGGSTFRRSATDGDEQAVEETGGDGHVE